MATITKSISVSDSCNRTKTTSSYWRCEPIASVLGDTAYASYTTTGGGTELCTSCDSFSSSSCLIVQSSSCPFVFKSVIWDSIDGYTLTDQTGGAGYSYATATYTEKPSTYTLTIKYNTAGSVYKTVEKELAGNATITPDDYAISISGYTYDGKYTTTSMDGTMGYSNQTLILYYTKTVVTIYFYLEVLYYKDGVVDSSLTKNKSLKSGTTISINTYKDSISGYSFDSSDPSGDFTLTSDRTLAMYYTNNVVKTQLKSPVITILDTTYDNVYFYIKNPNSSADATCYITGINNTSASPVFIGAGKTTSTITDTWKDGETTKSIYAVLEPTDTTNYYTSDKGWIRGIERPEKVVTITKPDLSGTTQYNYTSYALSVKNPNSFAVDVYVGGNLWVSNLEGGSTKTAPTSQFTASQESVSYTVFFKYNGSNSDSSQVTIWKLPLAPELSYSISEDQLTYDVTIKNPSRNGTMSLIYSIDSGSYQVLAQTISSGGVTVITLEYIGGVTHTFSAYFAESNTYNSVTKSITIIANSVAPVFGDSDVDSSGYSVKIYNTNGFDGTLYLNENGGDSKSIGSINSGSYYTHKGTWGEDETSVTINAFFILNGSKTSTSSITIKKPTKLNAPILYESSNRSTYATFGVRNDNPTAVIFNGYATDSSGEMIGSRFTLSVSVYNTNAKPIKWGDTTDSKIYMYGYFSADGYLDSASVKSDPITRKLSSPDLSQTSEYSYGSYTLKISNPSENPTVNVYVSINGGTASLFKSGVQSGETVTGDAIDFSSTQEYVQVSAYFVSEGISSDSSSIKIWKMPLAPVLGSEDISTNGYTILINNPTKNQHVRYYWSRNGGSYTLGSKNIAPGGQGELTFSDFAQSSRDIISIYFLEVSDVKTYTSVPVSIDVSKPGSSFILTVNHYKGLTKYNSQEYILAANTTIYPKLYATTVAGYYPITYSRESSFSLTSNTPLNITYNLQPEGMITRTMEVTDICIDNKCQGVALGNTSDASYTIGSGGTEACSNCEIKSGYCIYALVCPYVFSSITWDSEITVGTTTYEYKSEEGGEGGDYAKGYYIPKTVEKCSLEISYVDFSDKKTIATQELTGYEKNKTINPATEFSTLPSDISSLSGYKIISENAYDPTSLAMDQDVNELIIYCETMETCSLTISYVRYSDKTSITTQTIEGYEKNKIINPAEEFTELPVDEFPILNNYKIISENAYDPTSLAMDQDVNELIIYCEPGQKLSAPVITFSQDSELVQFVIVNKNDLKSEDSITFIGILYDMNGKVLYNNIEKTFKKTTYSAISNFYWSITDGTSVTLVGYFKGEGGYINSETTTSTVTQEVIAPQLTQVFPGDTMTWAFSVKNTNNGMVDIYIDDELTFTNIIGGESKTYTGSWGGRISITSLVYFIRKADNKQSKTVSITLDLTSQITKSPKLTLLSNDSNKYSFRIENNNNYGVLLNVWKNEKTKIIEDMSLDSLAYKDCEYSWQLGESSVSYYGQFFQTGLGTSQNSTLLVISKPKEYILTVIYKVKTTGETIKTESIHLYEMKPIYLDESENYINIPDGYKPVSYDPSESFYLLKDSTLTVYVVKVLYSPIISEYSNTEEKCVFKIKNTNEVDVIFAGQLLNEYGAVLAEVEKAIEAPIKDAEGNLQESYALYSINWKEIDASILTLQGIFEVASRPAGYSDSKIAEGSITKEFLAPDVELASLTEKNYSLNIINKNSDAVDVYITTEDQPIIKDLAGFGEQVLTYDWPTDTSITSITYTFYFKRDFDEKQSDHSRFTVEKLKQLLSPVIEVTETDRHKMIIKITNNNDLEVDCSINQVKLQSLDKNGGNCVWEKDWKEGEEQSIISISFAPTDSSQKLQYIESSTDYTLKRAVKEDLIAPVLKGDTNQTNCIFNIINNNEVQTTLVGQIITDDSTVIIDNMTISLDPKDTHLILINWGNLGETEKVTLKGYFKGNDIYSDTDSVSTSVIKTNYVQLSDPILITGTLTYATYNVTIQNNNSNEVSCYVNGVLYKDLIPAQGQIIYQQNWQSNEESKQIQVYFYNESYQYPQSSVVLSEKMNRPSAPISSTLRNSAWGFNNTISTNEIHERFNINGYCDDLYFTLLKIGYNKTDSVANYITVTDISGSDQLISNNGLPLYKVLHLTQGEDEDNETLVSWLQQNAINLETEYNLSNLELSTGNYSVTAKAQATNCQESNASNAVNYILYSVTANLTGVTSDSSNTMFMSAGDINYFVFTAKDGYTLPTTVSIDNATENSYTIITE